MNFRGESGSSIARDTKEIDGRIFVVGASRSGTTLLQCLLAGHPRIQGYPETGLFLRALGMRFHAVPWALLGISLGLERKSLNFLMRHMGREDLADNIPRSVHLGSSIKQGISLMDQIAIDNKKSIWVEKTPRHIYHANWIAGNIPGAGVVHIVRDGREVVASLYDRARKHPRRFGKQKALNYGIKFWNKAVARTYKSLGSSRQWVVVYEDLVNNPQLVLTNMCNELGIEYSPDMLEMSSSLSCIRPRETWKNKVMDKIEPGNSKFESLFDPDTQQRIEDRLNMSAYREIRDYSGRM